MRLFAAVLPPEPVLTELGARVDALHRLPGADTLRWTERPGWHLTLAFFGEVTDEVRPGLEGFLGLLSLLSHLLLLAVVVNQVAVGSRSADGRTWSACSAAHGRGSPLRSM